MPQQSPLDLPEGDPFGPHNLPYGVFSTATAGDGEARRRIGVRIGGHVLDAGRPRPRSDPRTPDCSGSPRSTRCSPRAAPPGRTCAAR